MKNYLFTLSLLFFLAQNPIAQVLDTNGATLFGTSAGISKMGRKNIFPSDGSTCLREVYNGGLSYAVTLGIHRFFKNKALSNIISGNREGTEQMLSPRKPTR